MFLISGMQQRTFPTQFVVKWLLTQLVSFLSSGLLLANKTNHI